MIRRDVCWNWSCCRTCRSNISTWHTTQAQNAQTYTVSPSLTLRWSYAQIVVFTVSQYTVWVVLKKCFLSCSCITQNRLLSSRARYALRLLVISGVCMVGIVIYICELRMTMFGKSIHIIGCKQALRCERSTYAMYAYSHKGAHTHAQLTEVNKRRVSPTGVRN